VRKIWIRRPEVARDSLKRPSEDSFRPLLQIA
jgi:hypothetical protein